MVHGDSQFCKIRIKSMVGNLLRVETRVFASSAAPQSLDYAHVPCFHIYDKDNISSIRNNIPLPHISHFD